MSRELTLRENLPASRHPAVVYVAGLASGSQRTMRDALNVVARELGANDAGEVDWGAVRSEHVKAIKARLVERGYKPATVNKILSAMRGVLAEAWDFGYMTAEDYQRAVKVKGITNDTLPAGRDVSPGEVEAVVSKCIDDASPAGARDAAIIACLWAGLRRAEVVKLDLADYDPQTGDLRVMGKGRKERIVPLGANGAKAAVGDWLNIRGDEPGPLFWRIRKGGKIVETRLTPDAVYHLLQKRIEQAKVDHLSPHDFRRTLAGDLLDAGADLATVQRIFGHADPGTTSRYDRRGDEAKRQAMGLLHFPYRRRLL